jgi:hypothetical protein
MPMFGLFGKCKARLRNIQQELTRSGRRLAAEYRLPASALPVLAREFGCTPCYLSHGPETPVFNPGVTRFEREIVFVSRSSNLVHRNDWEAVYASQPHNTVCLVHRYDEDLNLIETRVLDDGLVRQAAPYGIEDLRLFTWKGSLCAIAAGIGPDGAGLSVTQMFVRFEDWRVASFATLPSPNGRKFEKNWIPVVKDDRLFLIYNFHPVTIYEFADGKLHWICGAPNHGLDFHVRGGTPLIPWNGHFIGLIHSVRKIDRKMYYSHAFAALDSNFDLIETSEPFFIQRPGIEFACGLIEYKGDLLVSYGVSDRAAAFCILPFSQIAQMVVAMGNPSKAG